MTADGPRGEPARRWHALEVRVPAAAAEVVSAWLWDYDLTGLEEDPDDPGRLVAFRAGPWDEAALAAAVAEWTAPLAGPGAPVAVRAFEVEDEDWGALWKRDWRPTPLGRALVVAPAWWDGALPPGRHVVRIDPGRAFGTGTHVSTALAWELLEPVLAGEAGGPLPRTYLDLGAGSGVLALGARALRPGLRIVATEADPDALRSLRANLDLNRARDRVLCVHTRAVPAAAGSVELASANLTDLEHRPVECALAAAAAPGGRVVLSGFRDEQAAAAESRWARLGCELEDRLSREGWTAFRWRKR